MTRKPKTKLILVAGLAVVAAALINGKAVPIYDGIGNPDEPYRYVSPPASQKRSTSPPTDAAGLFNISDLTNNLNGLYVSSNETGPQVAVNLGENSLILSPEAKTVDIKAVPLAPTVQPSDGTIAGNVYRLTITPNTGTVEFRFLANSSTSYIDLRLPQGFLSQPVMEHKPVNGSWMRVGTSQVGNDIYEAQLSDVGDYALVIPKSTVSKIHHQHKIKTALVIGILIIIAAMIAIIFVIRSGSKKGRQ